MNLREVNGRMAVDQHVEGIAGIRAVELRDADPVRGRWQSQGVARTQSARSARHWTI
jgi:hypothetical protein